MGYEIESPYIDIYHSSVVTENLQVGLPGNKGSFKIFTRYDDAHFGSARIKLIKGSGALIKSEVFIMLNDLKFNKKGMLLPSSYKKGSKKPLSSDDIRKYVSDDAQKVISDILRECRTDFEDCFDKKISEAELRKILQEKFKDKNYTFEK